MTYTYVEMTVSFAVYNEVKRLLLKAGYEQAVHIDGDKEVLDMSGIALTPTPLHGAAQPITLPDMPKNK